MPNWTENRVEVSGDPIAIKEFIEFVRGENPEEVFSFESIMPMPDSLDIEKGSELCNGSHAICTERWLEIAREDRDITRRALINSLAFGFQDWYEWRRFKWGTKWDCCEDVIVEQTEDTVVYKFQTAWSGPSGIADALRSAFPELSILWECLDENYQCIENEEADEDSDERWVYTSIEEGNPHIYTI